MLNKILKSMTALAVVASFGANATSNIPTGFYVGAGISGSSLKVKNKIDGSKYVKNHITDVFNTAVAGDNANLTEEGKIHLIEINAGNLRNLNNEQIWAAYSEAEGLNGGALLSTPAQDMVRGWYNAIEQDLTNAGLAIDRSVNGEGVVAINGVMQDTTIANPTQNYLGAPNNHRIADPATYLNAIKFDDITKSLNADVRFKKTKINPAINLFVGYQWAIDQLIVGTEVFGSMSFGKNKLQNKANLFTKATDLKETFKIGLRPMVGFKCCDSVALFATVSLSADRSKLTLTDTDGAKISKSKTKFGYAFGLKARIYPTSNIFVDVGAEFAPSRNLKFKFKEGIENKVSKRAITGSISVGFNF